MNIAELCSHPALTIQPGQPLAQAAHQMIDSKVGALVVVEDAAQGRGAVGMITDRDIVCGQFSRRADLHCLTVGEVMSSPALCVRQEQSAEEAIGLLRARGFRRAPVIDAGGGVIGVIALDDLLPVLAGELTAVARLMSLHRRGPSAQ